MRYFSILRGFTLKGRPRQSEWASLRVNHGLFSTNGGRGTTASVKLNSGSSRPSELRRLADCGPRQGPFRSFLAAQVSARLPHGQPGYRERRDILRALQDVAACWPAGPQREDRRSGSSNLRAPSPAAGLRSTTHNAAANFYGTNEHRSLSLGSCHPTASLPARNAQRAE